jgi:hypothetical protein
MPSTVRLSQRGGCFSVAGAFTNPLNNKGTKQQRKTGSSAFAVGLVFTSALNLTFSPRRRNSNRTFQVL